jgi:hypothetical protein
MHHHLHKNGNSRLLERSTDGFPSHRLSGNGPGTVQLHSGLQQYQTLFEWKAPLQNVLLNIIPSDSCWSPWSSTGFSSSDRGLKMSSPFFATKSLILRRRDWSNLPRAKGQRNRWLITSFMKTITLSKRISNSIGWLWSKSRNKHFEKLYQRTTRVSSFSFIIIVSSHPHNHHHDIHYASTMESGGLDDSHLVLRYYNFYKSLLHHFIVCDLNSTSHYQQWTFLLDPRESEPRFHYDWWYLVA